MNFNQNLPDKKESISEDDADKNTLSIDEFFRQLEEREKDLHISRTDTIIEIDETAYVEDAYVPDFMKQDFPAAPAAETSRPKTNGIAPKSADASAALENRIASLQNQIAKLETERGEIIEISRRRQTDFDNFKKRIERDRTDTFRNQLGNLATKMLPVLDNLNRALDAASGYNDGVGGGDNPQNFQQFFEGIMLVNQQLGEVLEEMGVQPIAAVGEPFDPHFHEAVAAEKDDAVPPNTITAELLRGYKIDDKVIRASMVKVSAKDKG